MSKNSFRSRRARRGEWREFVRLQQPAAATPSTACNFIKLIYSNDENENSFGSFFRSAALPSPLSLAPPFSGQTVGHLSAGDLRLTFDASVCSRVYACHCERTFCFSFSIFSFTRFSSPREQSANRTFLSGVLLVACALAPRRWRMTQSDPLPRSVDGRCSHSSPRRGDDASQPFHSAQLNSSKREIRQVELNERLTSSSAPKSSPQSAMLHKIISLISLLSVVSHSLLSGSFPPGISTLTARRQLFLRHPSRCHLHFL